MLSKINIFNKKSDKKTELYQLNHENQEKQNNQKYVNRLQKSLKLTGGEAFLVNKLCPQKNYQANADNKQNLSLNFNLNDQTGVEKQKDGVKHQSNEPLTEKINKQSITQQYHDIYGKEIIMNYQIKPFKKIDFLKNHQIDGQLRARMLDWMVEVTKSYKFINKSYFASVDLMDRYFECTAESIPVSQLHIIGVIAMYIASKMDEIYPLKIKTIYEKIVHKKISKESLIETEKKVFDVLGQKLNSWTFFDLALLKLADQFDKDNEQLRNKAQEIISFVSKCILYDYELYLRYGMDSLAKVLVEIATKICNLTAKNQSYSITCHEEIAKSCRKLIGNPKGLNNIFKFQDQKIIDLVITYFK